MAEGTWEYVHAEAIATGYDAFVARTALCELDITWLRRWFPPTAAASGPSVAAEDCRDANASGGPAGPRGLGTAGRASPLVVDLGCGTGRVALPLADLGYRVLGVDLSQAMLEQLRRKQIRRQSEAGSTSGRVCDVGSRGRLIGGVRANLVELGCLGDGVADAAVCMFSTLGMVLGRRHRRAVLSHASRIVRPGGQFVVHVHNRWASLREPGGWWRLLGSWVGSRRRGGTVEFGDAVYPYRGLERMFMHRFSRRELLDDLAACGWRVTDCEGVTPEGSRAIRPRMPLQLDCGGFLVRCLRRPSGAERGS